MICSFELKTILVVDDFEPFRLFLCSMLQDAGFQISGEASDGFEAIQKAKELLPSLILLDIRLPKLNGMEAAKRIRDISPCSRILFVSQQTDADVVRLALSAGALGYLHKSRVSEELFTAIDSILAGQKFVSGSLIGSHGRGKHITKAKRGSTHMAFRFEFDPIHRILRAGFSEDVTNDDLAYFYRMSALLVESLDPLSGIIDFSAVTSFKSSAEFMRELAALPPAMPRTERPRVVVAPMDDVFRLARLFEMQGRATRPNFHVVRSAQQAWAILGVQEPKFKPVEQAWESRDGSSNS